MATITLIDADTAAVSPLKVALEQRGHTCAVLSDGTSALDALRQTPPDAIVLSVELPQTSGYSLCNKIKRDSGLQGVPLLLVSGQATAETFEEHKRLRTRADAYGYKPYDVDAAISTLEGLLGGSSEPEAPVERTEQARVSADEGPHKAQAVRFGEDPSVRDISSSPFLRGEEHAQEDVEPVDFAASTQVLTPEQWTEGAADESEHDLTPPQTTDSAGFAEEQAWVERALMGLGNEPTQAIEAAAPTEALTAVPAEETDPSPDPLHGTEDAQSPEADIPAPEPEAAPVAPGDFPHDSDVFSRPTAALGEPAERQLAPIEDARPTEIDPPKRKRATRGGEKKPARRKSGGHPQQPTSQTSSSASDATLAESLADDVTWAAKELARLARALDEAIVAKDQLEQRIITIAQRIERSSTQDDQSS